MLSSPVLLTVHNAFRRCCKIVLEILQLLYRAFHSTQKLVYAELR